MDLPRSQSRTFKSRPFLIIAALFAIGVAVFALARSGSSDPILDSSTLYVDVVQRGEFVVEVRGSGTLVPEHIRQITAQASARVERVAVSNGQRISSGDVLLELANPDLAIQSMQAEQQARQAQIDLLNLRVNVQTAHLTQESVIAITRTQHYTATQESLAADSLLRKLLIASQDANNKRALAQELATRMQIEEKRLALMNQYVDSQLIVQAAQVDQLRSIAARQSEKLRSLQVRTPEAGVVQDLSLQLGQWVPEGTVLAKIVEPGSLKAVIKIPETQASAVRIGMNASVDTRNGVLAGRVVRKDAAAQSGTVSIDIAFSSALPPGAVPDLSVDGVVQIERLSSVLFVKRPSSGQAAGLVRLYKLASDGKSAIPVTVRLGRSSVTTVEVTEGLHQGDRVILSDLGQAESAQRLRIR